MGLSIRRSASIKTAFRRRRRGVVEVFLVRQGRLGHRPHHGRDTDEVGLEDVRGDREYRDCPLILSLSRKGEGKRRAGADDRPAEHYEAGRKSGEEYF